MNDRMKVDKERMMRLISMDEADGLDGFGGVAGFQIRIEDDVREKILNLLASGANESFEDGMTSEFSKEFQKLVLDLKESVHSILGLIEEALVDPEANPVVVGEAYRWLGQMDDEETHEERRKIMERGLRHERTAARDGAILGISFLGDTESLEPLLKAYEEESSSELKADIMQVIDQLRE